MVVQSVSSTLPRTCSLNDSFRATHTRDMFPKHHHLQLHNPHQTACNNQALDITVSHLAHIHHYLHCSSHCTSASSSLCRSHTCRQHITRYTAQPSDPMLHQMSLSGTQYTEPRCQDCTIPVDKSTPSPTRTPTHSSIRVHTDHCTTTSTGRSCCRSDQRCNIASHIRTIRERTRTQRDHQHLYHKNNSNNNNTAAALVPAIARTRR